MNLFKKLLGKVNGLNYNQEYLCLSRESLRQPLHAYLTGGGRVLQEITDHHCFVGYCPLIFALPLSAETNPADNIEVLFSEEPLPINAIFRKKDAIAGLYLKKIREQSFAGEVMGFYEGVQGDHRFIPAANQAAIRLHNRLYGRKPGNVFLKGNLYDQVQVAYAVPRRICLVSVGHDELFNLFPTDLHGGTGHHSYIISLRHEGQACRQVLATRKIVLSDMHSYMYKAVYALGKNHMQPLKERACLNFSGTHSKNFRLPLPPGHVAYTELELEDSFVHGIHRILLFRTVYREQTDRCASTLVHVHNVYATWQYKKGLESNYLLR